MINAAMTDQGCPLLTRGNRPMPRSIQPATCKAAPTARGSSDNRPDPGWTRIIRVHVVLALALAAAFTLGACTTTRPTTKEPAITITAAEAAAIAETTIRDAARAASLADKLHRETDPNTDDVACSDKNGNETGLTRVRRAFTIEGLETSVMLNGARTIRDHLAKNGWIISSDQTAPDPGIGVSALNPHNGLYASIDAANHGILIIMSSGCLKPGTLSTSPSASTQK